MIGREKEIEILNEVCNLNKSSFVTIYGRFGIGKTYLVNYFFEKNRNNYLFFEFTGKYKTNTKIQIVNFIQQVYEWFHSEPNFEIKHWNDAFRFLKYTIDEEIQKRNHKEKIIIFLDEVPWIDEFNKSGFLSSLGYFWNTYCEERKNIILILGGSNSSWMRDRLIQNAKGSLYQRVTHKISLKPFDFKETYQYLVQEKEFILNKKSVINYYMIFGGVPKYYSLLNSKESDLVNINRLFFSIDTLMHNEYEDLFSFLFFKKAKYYKSIIELLCSRCTGYSLSDMAKILNIKSGAKLSSSLIELEECGYIKRIPNNRNLLRGTKYRIVDSYILFYNSWVKEFSRNDLANLDNDYWLNKCDCKSYEFWFDYASEIVSISNIR